MSLLGEMHFEKNVSSTFKQSFPRSRADLPLFLPQPGSICSLPRSEGIAYVHQQSFLRNLSVRDNVTFGAPFNRERYDQVLVACGLEQDLTMFKAGDLTEVGEKGITLSGGDFAFPPCSPFSPVADFPSTLSL